MDVLKKHTFCADTLGGLAADKWNIILVVIKSFKG